MAKKITEGEKQLIKAVVETIMECMKELRKDIISVLDHQDQYRSGYGQALSVPTKRRKDYMFLNIVNFHWRDLRSGCRPVEGDIFILGNRNGIYEHVLRADESGQYVYDVADASLLAPSCMVVPKEDRDKALFWKLIGSMAERKDDNAQISWQVVEGYAGFRKGKPYREG